MVRAIWNSLSDRIERIDLAGWLLLVAGAATVVIATLTPLAVDAASIRAQRDVLVAEGDRLEAELANYRAFTRAVREGDPLLLQRLAWHDLHLKPAGARVLDGVHPMATSPRTPVEHWLREPATFDPTSPPRVHSRLVRLTTGHYRPHLFAIGAFLAAAGVVYPLRSSDPSNRST
jgi:hypothetical protein